MEETTGGADAIKDSTSNANDGTDSGSPNLDATGQIDGADAFDGTDDYVSCGNDASLNITDTITISAWVKLSELSRPNGIISKGAYSLKIAPDNKIVFGGRIFSDGTTWTEVEDTTETYIMSLAVFNGYLYAGTGGSGKIFRSSDGTTWTEVEDTTETYIMSLAVFNGYLYAGTANNGKIFRSSDGTTWTEVKDTTETRIHSLAVFNGYLYTGTGGNGKIFRMGGGFDVYSDISISQDEYVHITAIYDKNLGSANAKIYINGSLDKSLDSSITIDTNMLNLLIGNSYGSTVGGYSSTGEENFNGSIDAVRISDSARSGDWIKTGYNNQNSPGTFYEVKGATPTGGSDPVPELPTAILFAVGLGVLVGYVYIGGRRRE